jgi:hypothetical protein
MFEESTLNRERSANMYQTTRRNITEDRVFVTMKSCELGCMLLLSGVCILGLALGESAQLHCRDLVRLQC